MPKDIVDYSVTWLPSRMTPDEIATMSWAVAQRFGLWKPKRKCKGPVDNVGWPNDHLECVVCGVVKTIRHEIPCPDLTQPEWAWRLLKTSKGTVWPVGNQWAANMNESGEASRHHYDTPEEALLVAAYQLVLQGRGLHRR